MQPLSKNKLKYIRSLHLAKYRQKYNNFIVEGHKSAIEFLKSSKYEVEEILTTKEWLEMHNGSIGTGLSSRISVAEKADIIQAGQYQSGGDILLVLKQKRDTAQYLLELQKPVFYLDDVQDPGNVGTILRIADWFGFAGVLRSEGSADFYNPKVVQSSMGSMNNLILANASLDDLERDRMLVLDMEGTDIDHWEADNTDIVVLGNEGNGANEATLLKTLRRLSIPGSSTKLAESLNVAISAGIVAAKFGGLFDKQKQ